jgi:ABC-type transport system involved in multi-copper enzyme maturation permease subunit
MEKLLKVLKFEVYKTVKNKFLLVSFSVFFVLFLVILVGTAYNYRFSDDRTDAERAAEMSGHEQERDRYKAYVDHFSGEAPLPNGNIPDENLKEFYLQAYEYYDYLIQTNTVMSDYSWSNVAHRGTYVMTYMTDMLGYIMPVFSLALAFFVLTGEYSGGALKNLLAAPVGRRTVFAGKVIFLCIVNLLIFLAAIAYPMCAGLTDLSARELVYGANGWYAPSVFTFLFLPKAAALFLSMLFYTTLSAILGQFFKKRAWGLIVPLLGYAAIQLTYAVIEQVAGVKIFLMPLAFMRYAQLDFINKALSLFSTGWLWLLVAGAAVGMFAALCVVLGGKKVAKQDY